MKHFALHLVAYYPQNSHLEIENCFEVRTSRVAVHQTKICFGQTFGRSPLTRSRIPITAGT
jgi:hypothetical protein